MLETMTTMEQILARYFSEIPGLRDRQAEAIARVAAGESLLYLAPTGSGKSLVYQAGGLMRGGLTLVISPLRALITQQAARLAVRGIPVLELHAEIPGKKQYELIRERVLHRNDLRFLFISPERAYADGYLQYALRTVRDRIRLVVVDEAHCISQWGHSFRPSYKMIPDFLDRIFGTEEWPPVLGLTATLNPADRTEIMHDFRLAEREVLSSAFLLRGNLSLHIERHRDELSKRRRLEDILAADPVAKTLVYVHRKSGKWGTRALAAHFGELGYSCDYYDADRDRADKQRVLSSFENGAVRIVFATNAFGMGVDIPDIRRVVHYLLPESIEQYYQEVGRAGRDGAPAEGVLLYTPVNIDVRRDLITKQFPTSETFQEVLERLDLREHPTTFNTYDAFADDSVGLQAYHLLERHGVIELAARGIVSLRDFTHNGAGDELQSLLGATRTGQLALTARRLGRPIQDIVDDVYTLFTREVLKLAGAPGKCLFLRAKTLLTPVIETAIHTHLQARLTTRQASFQRLADALTPTTTIDDAVRKELGLASS